MSGKVHSPKVVEGVIKFLRDAFRGQDGAEGESVHFVCDELERRMRMTCATCRHVQHCRADDKTPDFYCASWEESK